MSSEWVFFCQCMLNSGVSDCRNAVPTIRRDVHSIHTHSVHDVHTVCSQARTNVHACLWLKSWWLSCVIFVRLKESVIRSAMSHPCWSFPLLLTSSPSQHAAPFRPRDLSPRQHCTPTNTSARTSSASSRTTSSVALTSKRNQVGKQR